MTHRIRSAAAFAAATLLAAPVRATGAQQLTVQLVGNAGILLSDGTTSLLVDLPYESGYSGYERYDPARLAPGGTVVSVITHAHRDHFDPSLFLARPSWRIIGPPSAIAFLPPDRVLGGTAWPWAC